MLSEKGLQDDRFWNGLLGQCRNGDVLATVYEAADALLAVRTQSLTQTRGPEQWKQFIARDCVAELVNTLREDPFAGRCAAKPRGYPGDAVLLDMAYRLIRPQPSDSDIGRLAFEATTNSPGSRSVRLRKHHVASFIDRIADEHPQPLIASIACGHLRELEWSDAYRRGRVQQVVGVDQDAESVAVLREVPYAERINPVCATIREFFGAVPAEAFHAVYAVGLFDYLDDATAAKVIAGMTRLLRPGGTVCVANLTPSLIDIGYMEAVMDWWMVYRYPEHLASLAREAVRELDATITSYPDRLGNVAYVEIRRTR